MNRWKLTEEIKEKYKPIIEEFLDKIDNMTDEEVENSDNEIFTIDLSDTELRPCTLQELMKEFEYDDSEFDDNGWEMDFWITMNRSYDKLTDTICINGCGMTFELKLTIDGFM